MKVLNVRNVHVALPMALDLMDREGIRRESRNGPVIMLPGGVTTVYEKPCERVMFWAQRDANPFFHLYEALWMLDGRDDIEPLVRYAKQIASYSDDGRTMHAAYGYRWRYYFGMFDQLRVIAKQLRANPEDRRNVLQMWDVHDLGNPSKDVACNTTATFQRDAAGRLDLAVFCRSNDIIWGAYGANAVHFTVLQEFMASEIGCEVGTFTQVSVNWHAYLEQYAKLDTLPRPNAYRTPGWGLYPGMTTIPMAGVTREDIRALLREADDDYRVMTINWDHPWCIMVQAMLKAHSLWRTLPAPERFQASRELLRLDSPVDWILAGAEWLERRYQRWLRKEA